MRRKLPSRGFNSLGRRAPLVRCRPAARRLGRDLMGAVPRPARLLGAVGQRRHQGGRPGTVRARVAAERPARPRRRPRPGVQRQVVRRLPLPGRARRRRRRSSTTPSTSRSCPTRRPRRSSPAPSTTSATDPASARRSACVRRLFPIVKGGTHRQPGARTVSAYRRSPTSTRSAPSSVQTTALFGAGWIDLHLDRPSRNARNRRRSRTRPARCSLDFDTVPAGPGAARWPTAGSASSAGRRSSPRSRSSSPPPAPTNSASARRLTEQAKPLGRPGLPGRAPDLDKKQFRPLVAFVETLPKPVEVTPTTRPSATARPAARSCSASIGCAVCHVPDMGGVKGVYSDFLLYTLDDPTPGGGGRATATAAAGAACRGRRTTRSRTSGRRRRCGAWPTRPRTCTTARRATLRDAILRHGGDAKSVTEAYKKLPPADQAAVVAFLNTLKAPPDAPPVGGRTAVAVNDRR